MELSLSTREDGVALPFVEEVSFLPSPNVNKFHELLHLLPSRYLSPPQAAEISRSSPGKVCHLSQIRERGRTPTFAIMSRVRNGADQLDESRSLWYKSGVLRIR